MNVIVDVTGIAIITTQAGEIISLVTVPTAQTTVTTGQREARFARMIKGNARPVRRNMTVGTPGAVPSFMHIVVAMTGYAFGWGRGVILRYVAGVTTRGHMPTGQRKPRVVMIEADETPVGRIVTISADRSESSFMHIVFAMTSDAFCIRFAKALATDMAAIAFDISMCSE